MTSLTFVSIAQTAIIAASYRVAMSSRRSSSVSFTRSTLYFALYLVLHSSNNTI
jgi:hypothetical protein